jgi:hypothetical protein
LGRRSCMCSASCPSDLRFKMFCKLFISAAKRRRQNLRNFITRPFKALLSRNERSIDCYDVSPYFSMQILQRACTVRPVCSKSFAMNQDKKTVFRSTQPERLSVRCMWVVSFPKYKRRFARGRRGSWVMDEQYLCVSVTNITVRPLVHSAEVPRPDS